MLQRTGGSSGSFPAERGPSELVRLSPGQELYAAGEPLIVAADDRTLVRAVRLASQRDPLFVADVAELPATVLGLVQPGDVVITMGAGRWVKLIQKIVMNCK